MAYIRLDLSALRHNLKLIESRSHGRFAAVLKDNAYGHGLKVIAKELSKEGVKRAVVRTRKEAEAIKEFFDYILVLSDTPKEDRFFYAINDLSALKEAPQNANLELKIDTGMHRNGIDPSEIVEAFRIILQRGLHLKGIFTHFRSADELGSELYWQQQRWKAVKEAVKELCKEHGLELPHFHSANSAALFRTGIEDDEFARVGIAFYGYIEYEEVFDMPPLKPVLSLWAKRIATKRIKKGERIGYGGRFEAERDMVVSTYDVGYADGIFRAMKSTTAGPILGRVSMDSIVVEGNAEEICVFKDAKKVAKELGTISYEVLVKLPVHLDRLCKPDSVDPSING